MGIKPKEDMEFFVEGVIDNFTVRKFILARSCRQAMYLFCREMKIPYSDDVPGLMAYNLLTGEEQYARSIDDPVEP